jgi:hypothetical protein
MVPRLIVLLEEVAVLLRVPSEGHGLVCLHAYYAFHIVLSAGLEELWRSEQIAVISQRYAALPYGLGLGDQITDRSESV